MNVLVTAASKHGATSEIAEAVAKQLIDHGLTVHVADPDDVIDLVGYDAVVLGSGVYAGHWLGAARELVDRLGADLAVREVWLFSCGPVGDPPKPDEDPVDVAPIMEATKAREHRLFAGRLDKSRLGFGEKAIIAALRAPTGDYRDWDEIAAWADHVAGQLTTRG